MANHTCLWDISSLYHYKVSNCGAPIICLTTTWMKLSPMNIEYGLLCYLREAILRTTISPACRSVITGNKITTTKAPTWQLYQLWYFEPLRDIFVCCINLTFSLTTLLMHACQLAKQLNISETDLPLQCYAFT